MDDFNKINNLCRVCLKNPPSATFSLNQTQVEKLSFIGDSSKIVRFNGQSPKLCTSCGTNLNSVYDFIIKLRSSTLRMKHEELAKDDQNHLDEDRTHQVTESSQLTEMTAVTSAISPSQSYEVTLPSGLFVINDVVDAKPNLAELEILQRQPQSNGASQSSQLNCDVKCVEPKPDPESEDSSSLAKSKSKIVDELNSNDSMDSTKMCEICDVALSSTSKMLRHVHEYSGPGFACPDERCNFIFTQKANLDKHIKSHKVINPYSCHLGDKTSARQIHSENEGFMNVQSLQNVNNA